MHEPWALADIERLRKQYSSTDTGVIAAELGRTTESVDAQARILGLAKDKRVFKGMGMPRWRPEDEAQLRDMYPNMSNLEIARLMGRSSKSIVSKAHWMGLKKSRERLHSMGATNVSKRWGKKSPEPEEIPDEARTQNTDRGPGSDPDGGLPVGEGRDA